MAVEVINNGLDQTSAINYTVITDSDADWSSVSADVYFYDKGTKSVYYKNSNGRISAILLRSITTASTATLTVDSTTTDIAEITAQAEALTIGNPTGLGRKFVIRLKDDGTARAITFNAVFRAIGVTLPTTTTISKTLYIGCFYNDVDSKWDVVAVKEEA